MIDMGYMKAIDLAISLYNRWITGIGVVELMSTILLTTTMLEMVHQLCDENKHIASKYSWRSTIERTVASDKRVTVTFIVSVISLILKCVQHDWRNGLSSPFPVAIAVGVPMELVRCTAGFKPKRQRRSQVSMGQVFAWQYYYGYLAIVLPDLMDRICRYETEQSLTITVHRLFLLVPESCHMETTFEKRVADHDDIEICKEMHPVVVPHCGSKGRVYKNQVYVIWKKDGQKDAVNVLMEGIAMLSNFYPMNLNKQQTGMTDKMKQIQVDNFCTALQGLLQTSPYTNHVEIVMFRDTDKLSDVVLQRVEKLTEHRVH